MRLLVLENGAQIDDYVCGEDPVTIGGGPHCTLRLADADAPERAVILQSTGDVWTVKSLAGADQGVLLNGEPLIDERRVAEGDRIGWKSYEVVIKADEAGAGGRASVGSMTRFVRYQLPQGSQVKREDEALSVRQATVLHGGQVNVRLARCEQPEQLMDIALGVLIETFGCQRAWCGLRRVNYGPMEYVEGRTVTGHTADLPATGENLKPRVLDRAQFVRVPENDTPEKQSILAGPLQGPDGTLGMVYIESSGPDRRFGEEDFDRFIYLLAVIAAQLDAIFKQIAKQRAETMDGEVAVAHFIQNRLTPRKLPQWETLQFGAFREPGRAHCRDVYDVVKLGNKMAGVLVAHSRAVGSAPALHMAQAQAAFRTSAMHLDAPHIFLRSLNALLHDGSAAHTLDCLMVVIDPDSGKIQFSHGGDVGGFIISARGEERPLGTAEPAIGEVKAHAYQSHAGRLAEGETLALFTPGVVSARNRSGEVFGRDRFVDILCDGFGQLASAMLKEMLSDLQAFTQGGSQPDDITVILAHRPE